MGTRIPEFFAQVTDQFVRESEATAVSMFEESPPRPERGF